MKAKVLALATTVVALFNTAAFAASRVAGGGSCCPPCPFCH
jgi:hypothetical protein